MLCQTIPQIFHSDTQTKYNFRALIFFFPPVCFSYDTRGSRKGQGTHWASEDSLGRRCRFDPRGLAPVLRVSEVTLLDDGLYRCRADFKTSPTLNAWVRLTVVGELVG